MNREPLEQHDKETTQAGRAGDYPDGLLEGIACQLVVLHEAQGEDSVLIRGVMPAPCEWLKVGIAHETQVVEASCVGDVLQEHSEEVPLPFAEAC